MAWRLACMLALRLLLAAPAQDFVTDGEWVQVHKQTEDSYGGPSRPSIRYGHAASASKDYLLIVLGYFFDREKTNAPIWLSDTWAMRLSSPHGWARLSEGATQAEAVEAYSAGAAPSQPSGRYGHTVVLAANGSAIIYGGQDGGASKHGTDSYEAGYDFSELWRLDVASAAWQLVQPRPGAPTPGARYRHTAALLGGTMYVYGGIAPGQGDVWAYRLRSNTWHRLAGEVNSAAGGPGRRVGATALPIFITPRRYGFLLYGGRLYDDPKGPLDNLLWFFNAFTREWSHLANSNTPPPARMYHAAAWLHVPSGAGDGFTQSYVGAISGGTTTTPALTCAADAWAFTVDCGVHTAHWYRLADMPQHTYDHSMVAGGTALFIFGGHLCSQTKGEAPFSYTNAAAMLDLRPRIPDFISHHGCDLLQEELDKAWPDPIKDWERQKKEAKQRPQQPHDEL